jgi:hypothetical protein
LRDCREHHLGRIESVSSWALPGACYLKAVLDEIFGEENFQNEIIWQRTNSHNETGPFGRGHDSIFFYTKSDVHVWHPKRVAFSEIQLKRYRQPEASGGCKAEFDGVALRPAQSEPGRRLSTCFQAVKLINRRTETAFAAFCFHTWSALKTLAHYFSGRCDDRRIEVETLQCDGQAGEIYRPSAHWKNAKPG